MKFQQLTKTIGGTIVKNSPSILTGLSVAGLVATTVMGVKATPKALAILEENVAEKNRAVVGPTTDDVTSVLSKKEIIKLTWKCYIPTAVMGAVSIACIIGSNSISLRRNAALASLYSLSETALKEYQAKVVEKIGEAKNKEIKEEIASDKMSRTPITKGEVIIGRGDTLCFDALSGRYFWSDMQSIKAAVNKINVRMRSEMFVTVSDLYSELDLEGTKMGDLVGWYIDDGDFEAEFSSHVTEDGRPCLVLDFSSQPRYCDRDF